MTRLIALLVLSASIALAQCSTSNISVAQARLLTAPKPIQEFAADLERHDFRGVMGDDEVLLPLTEKRFGSPVRSIGSGIIRFQWELVGGTLTVGGGEATFDKQNNRIWLIPDRTRLLTALSGNFEMTTLPRPRMMYWLGDVYLTRDGTYKFVDSGPEFSKQRREQKSNFLIANPEGKYAVEYARGCGPATMMQNQPDGTVVATLTFSVDSSRREIFSLVYSESSRRLSFRSTKPIDYRLEN